MDQKLKNKLDTEEKDYEAVKEVHDMGAKESVTDHEHEFRSTGGYEAQCSCGWGVFIKPDEIAEFNLHVNSRR